MTYEDIIQDQHQIDAVAWTGVFGNSNRIKHLGKEVLKQALESGGNLGTWLLENKGGVNHDADLAAKHIVNDVVCYYRDGFNWKTSTTLDHFMVDYDIKEYLLEHLGATGWGDLTDAENYPQKELPDWDKLVREPW